MARLPDGKSPASDVADVGGAALKLVGAPDFIGPLVTLAGIRSNGSIDGFMKQTLKTMKQSGLQAEYREVGEADRAFAAEIVRQALQKATQEHTADRQIQFITSALQGLNQLQLWFQHEVDVEDVRELPDDAQRYLDQLFALVAAAVHRWYNSDPAARDLAIAKAITLLLIRTERLPEKLDQIQRSLDQLKQTPAETLTPEQQRVSTLTSQEALALGLILSDPDPAGRGAWMYPLQHDLTVRGLSSAEAGSALASLSNKGLVQRQDVPTEDSLTDRTKTAPAYAVTEAGLSLAQAFGDAVLRKRDYKKTVLFAAIDQSIAEEFLDSVRAMPDVQRQTRYFPHDDLPGEFRMYVFAYDEISDDALNAVAEQHQITIRRIEDD